MKKQKSNQAGFAHIALLAVAVVLSIIGLVGYKVYSASGYGVSYTNPPKFIQHEFLDLDRITSISKFRSAAGHDFSAGGEICSSMKHYFSPNVSADDQIDSKDVSKKIAALQPDGKTDATIYSPVTGTIVKIESEHTAIGKQIWIVPDSAKSYTIRLFHVTPSKNLKGTRLIFLSGSHVTAGEKIGVISAKQDIDIAIQTGTNGMAQHFISYFDVMPDSMFASYQTRGLGSRSSVIISKAERAAHPLDCKHDSEESFIYPTNYDQSVDYVRLSGYVAPKNTPTSNGTSSVDNSAQATPSNTGVNNVCNVVAGASKPPGCP